MSTPDEIAFRNHLWKEVCRTVKTEKQTMADDKKTIEQLREELREAEEDLERAELERKIQKARRKAAAARNFDDPSYAFSELKHTPGLGPGKTGNAGFGIGKFGDDPSADKFGDDPSADKFGDNPSADKICDALFKRMEIENLRRDIARTRGELDVLCPRSRPGSLVFVDWLSPVTW